MKAKTFIVLAISLSAVMFVSSVSAQTVKYPKIHAGIRLGGTFNSVTVSGEHIDGVNGKTWFTAGLAMDFRIAPMPLYLETGAYFVDRSIDGIRNNYGGQVPVLLSYHYYIGDKSAIQPFAGGYVGYAQEVGYGIRAGVGINYGRLYANVGYDFDLGERDIEKSYKSAKYKASGLFVTIGFNFAGSR